MFLSLNFVLWVSRCFECGERRAAGEDFERFSCFDFGASTMFGRSRLYFACAPVLVMWFLQTTVRVMPNFQFGKLDVR